MMTMSIADKAFRRLFVSFFMLACLVPLLLTIFMIYHYTVPLLAPAQFMRLRRVFDLGLVGIVVFQALGFALIWWWGICLERLIREAERLLGRHLKSPGAEVAGRSELWRIDRLVRSLGRELQTKEAQADSDAQRLEALDREVTALASTDPLTGLFNRRHFLHQLASAARRAERLGMNFWLVRLQVNRLASYGEKNADHILRTVGRIVQQTLPAHALPFATDRNAFALILHRGDGREVARITYRLVQAIEGAAYQSTAGVPLGGVTVSCGIAGYKENVALLTRDAWRAMETAERLGRPIEVAGS